MIIFKRVLCFAALRQFFSKRRPFRYRKGADDDHTKKNWKQNRFAVLVDAENAQSSSLEYILKEVVSHGGNPTVRRIYGDFTKPNLSPWKNASLNHSFLSVNAFSYVSGKGSSDAAMMIEAMDLLHTNNNIDGFALVSSDSDFTRLAQRLREAEKEVLGFGRRHTPEPFVRACGRFVYTENLGDASLDDTVAANSTTALSGNAATEIGDFLPFITKIVDDMSGDNGWTTLSLVGDVLSTTKNDFDVRTYGYKRLSDLFAAYPDRFEIRVEGLSTYQVRNTPPPDS